MTRKIVLTILLLLAVSSSYTLPAFAKPSVQQTTTTTPACPTYQVYILVDLVDSHPIQVAVGDIVVTKVHVIYPDGTPVMLSPETISFLFRGSKGEKEFDNVQVIYTGIPGFYNYTQTITAELIQATGEGKVTIFVVRCSCSDVGGNRGPMGLVSSDVTLTPSDNSNLNIGIAQPPSPFGQESTYFVLFFIFLLLLIALLLFLLFLRRRRGQQQK